MKSMVPVWVVVIDKSTSSYPMYVKNVLAEPQVIWDHYNSNNRAFEGIVRKILGINMDAPVVFNTFCDYLINPASGIIMSNDGGETLGEFMMKSFDRHVELIESAGVVAVGRGRAWYVER